MANGFAVDRMEWALMAKLLSVEDLPAGFDYPPQFVRVVELGLMQLEPWWIIEGDQLSERYRGLQERYPNRVLIPFAIRQDRDDVACFEPSSERVVLLHDFASPGHEDRGSLDGFDSWFRTAIEDLIEFGSS